jgi:hypothetical protein
MQWPSLHQYVSESITHLCHCLVVFGSCVVHQACMVSWALNDFPTQLSEVQGVRCQGALVTVAELEALAWCI